MENILEAIDQGNKREDNLSENKEKSSIDDLDGLSVKSSVKGSSPLVMAATKVNDLCSEGVVVTERIENEFETRNISRELFLIVNEEKVNFQLKKKCSRLGRAKIYG